MDVLAEVAGSVWKIEAQPGQALQAGDVVMIIESMKMEIPVEAARAGSLVEMIVNEGDQIAEGDLLFRLA
ncbi:MAG: acetyl-CoA carboxylase biotin carboxyl carrier protein subunit [Burkholderiaceae bacterium]